MHARLAAQTVGLIWAGLGLVIMGILLATGRRVELDAEEKI